MLIRIHLEGRPGERRVAVAPREARRLVEMGNRILVPAGAGAGAAFPDADYVAAGAEVFAGAPPRAELLLGVGPLTAADVAGVEAAAGFFDPLGDPAGMAAVAATGVTALAMELVPRTTLAQSMDALSSQATVAGYQAVLLAASVLPRMFPMLMTAAGTIRPARVLVLGAGVAGLQAIATARRLGAIVSGYDIRPAAREQVESLGARFVGGPVEAAAEGQGGYASEVDDATRSAQQEALAAAVAESDVVITTAQVPGRRAPLLVTAAMVEAMRPGAVVVDLAASTGGNCEATIADEAVSVGMVTVLGPTDLASGAAGDASEMYGRNLVALLDHLITDGALVIDPEDEIAAAVCVTRDGSVQDPRVLAALEGAR